MKDVKQIEETINYIYNKADFIKEAMAILKFIITHPDDASSKEEYKIYLNRLSTTLATLNMVKPEFLEDVRQFMKSNKREIEHHE